MNKKGQLQIQETILVLFIFTLIVGLSLIVFYRFNVNSIKEDTLAYEEYKFKQLIDVIPNLPELRLSEIGIESDWCIDLLKAKAFSDLQDNYDFGYTKIGIGDFILYDNSRESESVRKYSTPVCIYDDDKYEMAKLEVEWYV